MNKLLCLGLVSFLAFSLIGCGNPSPELVNKVPGIDRKLATFPRFPEAVMGARSIPILPVSVDTFVVLALDEKQNFLVNDEPAQFEFAALELSLQFWSLQQQRLVPFNGAGIVTTIGADVHFFADQQLHSLTVVGELADYLLLALKDSSFSPSLIGRPVFNPDGQIVGLIHSFDINNQQLQVLKYSVIRTFWLGNQ